MLEVSSDPLCALRRVRSKIRASPSGARAATHLSDQHRCDLRTGDLFRAPPGFMPGRLEECLLYDERRTIL